MVKPLDEKELEGALAQLPDWKVEKDGLARSVEFNDFNEALAFIVRVGLLAEKSDHHPAIFNIYNRVRISLNTHDADNKVTSKDVDLAKAIQDLFR